MYIDPKEQLITAVQAMLDSGDSDLYDPERRAVCAALYRCRWTNDAASLKELADRFGRLKSEEYADFCETIKAVSAGDVDVGKFHPRVFTQVMEDGRIEMRGEKLPPHPDLIVTYPNGWSLLDYITPRDALHYCIVRENNVKRDYDEARLTDPNWSNAAWQVIFKTKDGLDFCRETYPTYLHTTGQVEDYAVAGIKTNKLGGAIIQLW